MTMGAPEQMLDGKVAIVTGGNRGIGRAIALALAERGVKLALVARTEASLNAVKAEIEALGGEAEAFVTDLAREADITALVRGTVERFGKLDILVNNAGLVKRVKLADMATADWDEIMTVNARGPFLLCREAIPHLKRHDVSWIVNIATALALKGYVDEGAYTASKHALLGMSKVLAQEVQADGIRVHMIYPGGVNTDMRRIPDGAILIQPEAIADAVVYLLTLRGNCVVDDLHVRRLSQVPFH
jgi:3-oxoacyl-[acyl-carrier protein] reductase